MKIHPNWKIYLGEEFKKEYYISLMNFIKEEEENNKIIYPPREEWFNALIIPPENINIVIIGQDPYHGKSQAHGFSFSVNNGVKIPPSLINIYKEIEAEFDYKMSKNNGNLLPWVNQGVLLLNNSLTVEQNKPASHKDKGWEKLTDKIISTISNNYENKVFLLWGKFAQSKENLIDSKKHLILKSAHPSPFSAHTGFFNNMHFIKANKYLIEHNKAPINWKIEDN